MSSVRVLVGTHKGRFVLTSDGARARWEVSGPHFPEWEIFHVTGSPADQNRLYASQHTSWFGRVIQRSDDGGATWNTVGNEFAYEGEPGTHQWYDGTPHPWEFARVWHLGPTLDDPDTVYAGVEDAALFRTTDGGVTWRELPGLRQHDTGDAWQPGAGGAVSAHHPARPTRSETHHHRDLRGRRLPERRRRRFVARGERQPAERLRLSNRRARARAGDVRRRADQDQRRALPARGETACLSQPDWRK